LGIFLSVYSGIEHGVDVVEDLFRRRLAAIGFGERCDQIWGQVGLSFGRFQMAESRLSKNAQRGYK